MVHTLSAKAVRSILGRELKKIKHVRLSKNKTNALLTVISWIAYYLNKRNSSPSFYDAMLRGTGAVVCGRIFRFRKQT